MAIANILSPHRSSKQITRFCSMHNDGSCTMYVVTEEKTEIASGILWV